MSAPDADTRALLRTIEFFAGCTDEQLDDVAKLAIDRYYLEGNDLCRQGEPSTDVFAIVEGEAAVVVDGEQVGVARRGDVVGELAMLGSGRRNATLTALTPVLVLVIDPHAVESVLAADPSSAQRLGRRDAT